MEIQVVQADITSVEVDVVGPRYGVDEPAADLLSLAVPDGKCLGEAGDRQMPRDEPDQCPPRRVRDSLARGPAAREAS
ncbi:hypothetical protein [Cellulomonas sp. SLBN-39]|uniref:hypothetical protein n=1 Tax=Cellulomonas sp. SLBN-39 TaxID=2768446 RepID=UPI00114FA91D